MKPRFLLSIILLIAASQALATSFVVPTDDELAARSAAIVVGTVEGSYTQDVNNTIETVYEVRLERAMKGAFGKNELVRVVSMGGVSGDRALFVPAEAHFEQGERVLLFLSRDGKGRWRTTDLTLGRFEFVTSTKGERLLVRDTEDVVGWDRSGRVHVEQVRREQGFLQFLENKLSGRAARTDYVVSASEVTVAPETQTDRFAVGTNAAPFAGATYTDFVNNQPIRWPNISAGVTFYKRSDTNISGAADGGVSTIQSGLAAWNNEPNSNINLLYGGQQAKASQNFDGVNMVEFNDPQGRVGGSWTGSGTVAITFISFGSSHSFAGLSWLSITDADVVFQDAYPATNAAFGTAMTHELGHAIGFRHSNENHVTGGACDPSQEECTTAAIMNAVSNAAYGFTLQPWDINAAQSVYPGSTSTCTAPAITAQPTSRTITSGTSTTLTVTATGTNLTYQWYTGTSGSTATPVSGATSASLTVSPTATTSYWVRVSNGCGTANSSTATVTVDAATCAAPTITAQPQSSTIPSGSYATVAVTATGTGLTYQWYVGASGNTSQPISGISGPSFQVSPGATTSYWVRVSNACGSVNSASATVTVTAACSAPAITAQPTSRTIDSGTSTTLSVSASGANLAYQWYVGTSGSTATPISGATGPSLTVSPTSTTNYWVRVSNSCGAVNSNTATVTVSAATCSAPTITAQPQSSTVTYGNYTTVGVTASGTGLTYQWYVGQSGDMSRPISGLTSPSFQVSPGATTSYWVRVTNACGSVNSATATVTVTAACTAPTITAQPQSSTIPYGSYTTVGVTASGSNLTYQWYVGQSGDTSRPISGLTSPSFQVSPGATTTYWVRVSNACGSVNSAAATVTVTAASSCSVPTITSQPQSSTVYYGEYTTVSVSASGTGLTYQWYVGQSGDTSRPISGLTTPSFQVSPGATTTYWVRVTNACGSVNSAAATVTVLAARQ
ncbi:MAG: hypothetical protein M3Q69_10890 [Acidobacteriota bacterium]|nr:hypothetical protein [Acidobacteriota bacterium]